jgi:hypothetical protein
MKPLLRLFLILWMAAASPALANEVLRRIPPVLAPGKAYVLVEIRNQDAGRLPGGIVLARYDPAGGDVRGGTRSPGTALGRGMDVRIAVASRPLERRPESRLYLVELEPDIWVIEGAGGTAFSLESRTFEIAAGQVLDLGVMSPVTDWPEGERAPGLTVGRVAALALLGPFARQPDPRPAMLEMRARGVGDFAVPEAIRTLVAPATFRPGARFGNYLGGLVNRIDGRRGRPGAVAAPSEPPAPAPPEAPAPANPS